VNKLCFALFTVLFNLALVQGQEKEDPNGYNKFYHANGEISSEGTLKNGKPEGYWRNYFESGVLKSEGNRLNHLLDSTWKFYSEDGILREEITYLAGKRNGKTVQYSQEGFKIAEMPYVDDVKEGIVFTYHNNGAEETETPFEKGKENGAAYEFNEKGDIIALMTYQNGFLIRQENINRRDRDGNRTGPWKEFYEDRVVHLEGSYKNDLKNGYWKEYSPKGLLLQTLKYDMGELVTDALELADLEFETEYHSSGGLSFRGTYRNGQPHGVHTWYDAQGNITGTKVFQDGAMIAEGLMDADGKRQGPWKEYYITSELKAEGKYKDGYRVEEWKYYFKSGQLEQTGNYGGKERPQGKWVWYYENGQLLREESFRNGREDGWLIEYSDTGKVITRGEFVDGREEGEWMIEIGDHLEEGVYQDGYKQGVWVHTYTSNGKVRFEGEYFDGIEIGKHVWYYDNGRKMLEGKYLNGIQEGPWNRYDSEGNIILSIEYNQGKEERVDGYKFKEPKEKSKSDEG